MRCSVVFAMGLLASILQPGAAEPSEQEGNNLIADGLSGWRMPTGEWANVGVAFPSPANDRLLATTKGSGVLVNGPTGKTTNLISQLEHGDVTLHVEFMVPKGSNSGVYLQGRYEIQVFDSWGIEKPEHSDCGGIYQRYEKSKQRGYEGHAPKRNASQPPGKWQTFDIVFRAPRFDATGTKTENARFVRVTHNDKVVHENVEVSGPTRAATFADEKPLGPLMFQGDHGPVAYRNLRVDPAP